MEDCRKRGEIILKRNKGVTLIELIIVIGLIALIIPLYWYYINSSVEDDAVINDKILVQSSVNALMNQLQRDIQEARNPINPSSDYTTVKDDGFLIRKPESIEGKFQSVLYKFDEDNNKVIVTYNLKLTITGNNVEINDVESPDKYTSEYNFIEDFSLTKEGTDGVKVMIDGKISNKSHYNLSNTYYTRNTI